MGQMPARSKYGAKKVRSMFKGKPVTYDSQAEARRGAELELLEQAGEIHDLERQVPFTLLPINLALGYKRPLTYISDFVFWRKGADPMGSYTVLDVKGHATEVYKIKKRLLQQLHGIRITEEP